MSEPNLPRVLPGSTYRRDEKTGERTITMRFVVPGNGGDEPPAECDSFHPRAPLLGVLEKGRTARKIEGDDWEVTVVFHGVRADQGPRA